MLTFFLGLFKSLFGAWLGWRSNRDQDLGQLQQQNVDLNAEIKNEHDAQDIQTKVNQKSDAELDADLAKRMPANGNNG